MSQKFTGAYYTCSLLCPTYTKSVGFYVTIIFVQMGKCVTTLSSHFFDKVRKGNHEVERRYRKVYHYQEVR